MTIKNSMKSTPPGTWYVALDLANAFFFLVPGHDDHKESFLCGAFTAKKVDSYRCELNYLC